MIHYDLAHLFPKFILKDKNGYAMAKALQAGIDYFLNAVQDGIDCILDPNKMPEWRMDEMAWELNSLYDYTANVEMKRKWIKDAIPLYSIWGTPQSILEYLLGYFDDAELEEASQYGGAPFHFRVTLGGDWTKKKEKWARRAIARAKNIRSVMDTLAYGAEATIKASGELEAVYRVPFRMTGTYPDYQIQNPIQINTLSVSPDMFENGHGYNVIVTWSLSRTPTSLKINNTTLPNMAMGGMGFANVWSVIGNQDFTMTATDENGIIAQKTVTLAAGHRIYWGAATKEEISEGHIHIVPGEDGDEAVIVYEVNPYKLPENTLTLKRGRTLTVQVDEGKYFWYCLPVSMGTPTFRTNKYMGDFVLDSTVRTGPYRGTFIEYAVYRSERTGLGDATVVVT